MFGVSCASHVTLQHTFVLGCAAGGLWEWSIELSHEVSVTSQSQCLVYPVLCCATFTD